MREVEDKCATRIRGVKRATLLCDALCYDSVAVLLQCWDDGVAVSF